MCFNGHLVENPLERFTINAFKDGPATRKYYDTLGEQVLWRPGYGRCCLGKITVEYSRIIFYSAELKFSALELLSVVNPSKMSSFEFLRAKKQRHKM
jgi:hypothetical protein